MTKISFFGASQEVTGSNFLVESENSKIIVDCGLFQGKSFYDTRNEKPFPYSVSGKNVSACVTHAHIDHIGRLPKLIKSGFRGRIFSNPATREFAELMLSDSLGVLQKEAAKKNKKPFYEMGDITELMKLWETVEYGEKFKLHDFEVNFKDAGHILGSAMIELEKDGKKIVFTGDLGNPPMPLLRKTEEITDANILIIDSTYAGKNHEDIKERKLILERIIEDTVKKKGVLIIPAFSLERTQEILFELNDLIEKGRVPKISVFVDSPLAINLIPIYKKYERYYNKETKYIINSGDDVFNFPNLRFTLKTEESKEINDVPPPKMIIAGSGMMNGGRINHHARRYLKGEENTVLFIGFQAAGTLGRKIQEGIKKVKIFGEEIAVKARVQTIHGYSAHPDQNGIFNFTQNTSETVKKVFAVHSEPKNAMFLIQRIRDYLGVEAIAPKNGDSFEV